MNPQLEALFDVLSVRELPEYQSTAIHLRHRATGCEILHLLNEEEENLFSFNFRTPPRDDTGEAHILEHSVLSGSRRFPLKDPFVLLLKSSLNTFLNAMTYPDKTIYPGSSQVEKDFYNLMLVYGDAVFFPLLREEVFMQEGHHLEYRELADPDSGLRRTGVVYNEMKGVFSTPESVAGSWSMRSLFPDTPYGLESGGDPRHIPELDYRRFREFHDLYYHPSNCRIFLYGNLPTERHLEFLQRNFLEGFTRIELDSRLPDQPRWSAPRRLEQTYPVQPQDPLERRSTVSVNWLTVSALDPRRLLALEVLAEVLLGNAGSPLRRALVESRLGEDLAPTSGLDTELRQVVFSAGLRGTDPDKVEAVEGLIAETLRRVRREGIEEERLRAAIHQVEFRNREIRRGGRPYALRLLGRCLRGWLHDVPPETTLEFRRWMEEFKEEVARRPNLLVGLLEELLIDNPHRSTLLVRPDPRQAEREAAEEAAGLSEQERRFTPAQREAVAAAGLRLKEFQQAPPSPEDLAKVPTLRKSDLPREVQRISVEESTLDDGVRLLTHDLFTNGIVYLDLAFRLDGLDEARSLDLPLFSRAVCAAGLPGVSYAQVAGQLALSAGGFSAGLDAATPVARPGGAAEYLIFRLRALAANLRPAVDLAGRLLREADFRDAKRLEDMVLELRNDFKASIVPAGSHYAALRAGSRFSAALHRAESWEGITQLLHIGGLAHRLKDGQAALADSLEALRGTLFCRERLVVNLTAEERDRPAAEEEIRRLLATLPAAGSLPLKARGGRRPAGSAGAGSAGTDGSADAEAIGADAAPSEAAPSEALVTATNVGYVARVIRGARFDSPESAWEAALSHLLSTDYLWERVRMRGGAYGASASPNGLEGTFTFSSYRDPNIVSTLTAFREGLEYARDTRFTEEQIEQALIGTVGREERPNAPGEKGMISLKRVLLGISDELRQARRDALLGLTPAQLSRAAARLLEGFEDGSSVVLSSRAAVEEAARELPELGRNIVELPG